MFGGSVVSAAAYIVFDSGVDLDSSPSAGRRSGGTAVVTGRGRLRPSPLDRGRE